MRARRAARDARSLNTKQLALRVVRGRDREAAVVLGDLQQEAGLGRVLTGRIRPAVFEVRSSFSAPSPGDKRVQTRAEVEAADRARERLRRNIASPWSDRWTRVRVPAAEAIYNVDRYAAQPSEERWGRIFTQWITPKRAVYRALVARGLLPRSTRFSDLFWEEIRWAGELEPGEQGLMPHHLYVQRVPKRRKRPQRAYLFDVIRLDEPETRGEHLHEPSEVGTSERDRARGRRRRA